MKNLRWALFSTNILFPILHSLKNMQTLIGTETAFLLGLTIIQGLPKSLMF